MEQPVQNVPSRLDPTVSELVNELTGCIGIMRNLAEQLNENVNPVLRITNQHTMDYAILALLGRAQTAEALVEKIQGEVASA